MGKPLNILRNYEFQKAMIYAIQDITGDQTHDIMATLVEMAEKHLSESDIDLSLTPKGNCKGDSWGYVSRKRMIKKYIYYPKTKLYVGCHTVYREKDFRSRTYLLNFNFKLPTDSIKLNEKEYNERITDGILCDASRDIEAPKLKSSLTEEEKVTRTEQNKLRAKEKAKKKRAAEKAKKP